MKTCPFCAEQIQDEAIKCKHCGERLTAAPQQSVGSPPPLQAPAPPSKPKGSKAWGCLGFVLLWIVVFWVADFAGCDWTKSNDAGTTTATRPKDPTLRYVGPNGAVAGYDNYGNPTRLPPGTAVRASGSSYMDPANGPTRIYIVTEGGLRGMQVPLSERDLEAQ